MTAKVLDELPRVKWFDIPLSDSKALERVLALRQRAENQEEMIRSLFDGKIEKLRRR